VRSYGLKVVQKSSDFRADGCEPVVRFGAPFLTEKGDFNPSSVRQILCSDRSATAVRQHPNGKAIKQRMVSKIVRRARILNLQDEALKNVRDIGAFAGLCPRRDQSGESDPRDQFVVPLVKFLPRRRFAFHISLHHCVTSFNNVIEIVVNRDIRIFSPSL
jgi:hypothetical protein